MSNIEAIREKLNNSPVGGLIPEIDELESILIEELNQVSYPYRRELERIRVMKKEHREAEIRNCEHDFERFCEYHNDVYFVCRKCGFEK